MRVKRLIEELQKCKPEAEVKLFSCDGNTVLYVEVDKQAEAYGYKDAVYLKDIQHVDLKNRLYARFIDIIAESKEKQCEFFKDLLDRGIDESLVRCEVGDLAATYMKRFCAENNLI